MKSVFLCFVFLAVALAIEEVTETRDEEAEFQRGFEDLDLNKVSWTMYCRK